jgi:hypothetical protein|tara:strand:- start:3286 stop:3567 length:282 start_codon:yes stop_codon:yes gene_type:complete
MVEEIISHTLDNYRGSINVEFIYSINESTETLSLEAFLDDLEPHGDLYDDLEDYGDPYDDVDSSVTFHKKIDVIGLQETLTNYIQNNPTVLDL